MKKDDLRKSFQPIQQGMLSDRELAFTCLTKQVRDALIFTMRSVSDQGLDPFIGHLVIIAIRIGTKVIVRADLLFPASLALGFTVWYMSCFWWRYAKRVPCLAIWTVIFCFYF
jgi:hypothetical protein